MKFTEKEITSWYICYYLPEYKNQDSHQCFADALNIEQWG
jgi:hypothetical protein